MIGIFEENNNYGSSSTSTNNSSSSGVGGIISVIDSVVPLTGLLDGLLGGIMGDISAAGLSCIRSTHKPSLSESNLKEKIAPYFESELAKINESNHTEALKQLQYVIRYANGSLTSIRGLLSESKWKNCSRFSLGIYKTWYDSFIQKLESKRVEMVNTIKAKGYNVTTSKVTYKTINWDVADMPNTFDGDFGLGLHGSYYSGNFSNFQVNESSITGNNPISTIGNLFTENTKLASGVKLLGGGFVLPFIIISALAYQLYDKYFNKNKKFKNTKSWKK